MSIINAEVTAKNRPASSGRQPCWFYEGGKTHKKESMLNGVSALCPYVRQPATAY